jgi:DNA-binding response OmpR family regulator
MPVIVLSGADQTECAGLLCAAITFGAAATLRKPIAPGDLQVAVRANLPRAEAELPR